MEEEVLKEEEGESEAEADEGEANKNTKSRTSMSDHKLTRGDTAGASWSAKFND